MKNKNQKFKNVIRNTKSLTVNELKALSKEHYQEKIAEEDKLIAAVAEGRCTNSKLVKKAEKIKQNRALMEKKKKKLKEELDSLS